MSKKKKKITRNPYVLPAKQRKAGPMKDRRIERGGNKNQQRELQKEVEEK